jgi:hypothetical protein
MGRQRRPKSTGQYRPSAALVAPLCLGLSVLATTAALAEGDKHLDDANVRLDYGLPVHKSGTVDSMDFGSAYGGGVQTFVGKSRSLGLGVRYETSATEYSQADATVRATWTDVTIGYRVWMLYPYLLLGSGAFAADLDGASLIDAIGVTRGGGLAVRISAGSKAVGFIDTRYAVIPESRDAAGQDVVIGPRLDVDAGVSISVPIPGTEIVTGYRYRSYDVEIDGTGAAELETGPYLGFEVGFSP